MKYYSGDKIRKTNADYMIIFGERSNGKTYDTLAYAIKKAHDTDGLEQFVYMRRLDSDISAKHAKQFIANHVDLVKELWGENATISYWSGDYFVHPDAESDNRYKIKIGSVMSVSGWLRYKGNAYPDVTTIILDEFLSATRYIYETPDSPLQEFNDFLNNVSTIVRNRTNVKIYLLGNTVSRESAYFKGFGIDPLRIRPGMIVTYKTKGGAVVSVEHTAPTEGGKKSDKFLSFNNTTSDMITKGDWQVYQYPDNYNSHSVSQLLQTRTYRNGFKIKMFSGNKSISIVIPTKMEMPIIISNKKMKTYDRIINNFQEIVFFNELKNAFAYRVASNNFISDDDFATEIFRNKLGKT